MQTVLDTLIPINHEVQIHKGNWYNMIIQPYRTLDNVIEGAVITFMTLQITNSEKINYCYQKKNTMNYLLLLMRE